MQNPTKRSLWGQGTELKEPPAHWNMSLCSPPTGDEEITPGTSSENLISTVQDIQKKGIGRHLRSSVSPRIHGEAPHIHTAATEWSMGVGSRS